VTPAWDMMKLHFPQECSEMQNRDVPSTLNYLHTSDDGSETHAGTLTVATDVTSGESNQFIGIHNNLVHKEKNSTNLNRKRSEFLLTNCSKCMCSIHKKNKAEQFRCTCSVLHDSRKYRPPARKGTQYPSILRDKSVLNCTDQYVTSKRRKENHPCFSDTCEQDNGNLVTSISNAESALEGASNYSMSIDCDITAILKEVEVTSPVSNLDDSFSDSSDMVVNISGYELDYSVMSENVRTEVHAAADINNCNKESTQFTSDAKGTLTPFVAHEDGPPVVCPITKEIYELKTVPAISSLDVPCIEVSDIIENIHSFQLDPSTLLEYVITEIQKAADVSNNNKDSTQFISDTTGTLTPFAAHEDGPPVVCPTTKEIYELKTVPAISSLDVPCIEVSDIIKNIPGLKPDQPITLEDVITEI
jgi:hypothetical protein